MNNMLEKQLSELNPLISMKGPLTSLEQDILALLILNIDDNPNTSLYQISVNELKRLTSSTDKNIYANVVKAVKKMWKREGFDVYINGNEVSLQIITSVEHLKSQGIIEVEISLKAKPFLYGLKEYLYGTTNVLPYLFSIKGKHSKKLYELCYLLNVRFGLTSIEISTEKLKSILGISADSYKQFKDLERRVLKEAVLDISGDESDTNMLFSYEKNNNNKRGMPVESVILKFEIVKKDEIDPVYINNKLYIYEKIDTFVSWGSLKYSKKEQLHIYTMIAEKKGLSHDSNAIIKSINTTVNLFISSGKTPGIETFIKEA